MGQLPGHAERVPSVEEQRGVLDVGNDDHSTRTRVPLAKRWVPPERVVER